MDLVQQSPSTRPGSPQVSMFGALGGDRYGETTERAPLVLLHGLTLDRRIWAPILRELADLDPTRQILNLDLPGHGASPPAPPHDIASVAATVHDAVVGAGLHAPVIVGHSISAVIATVYAAIYPSRGVINVDQSLDVDPFAGFIKSLAPALRGPDFAQTWRAFNASFHTELLPDDMAALVTSTSRPEQVIVLSYWSELLDGDPADMADMARACLTKLCDRRVPYLIVVGTTPDPTYREWLRSVLPHARVEIWPGGGHFPHLAHLREFAALLAATP